MRVLLLVLAGVVLMGVYSGCAHREKGEEVAQTESGPKAAQGKPSGPPAVYGVVRESPPRGMPPQGSPSPGSLTPGATVSLRLLVNKEAPAGEMVASTVTDSAGMYRLEADPGSYFLVVTKADIRYPRYTTGYLGKNFAETDSVHLSRMITLDRGEKELDLVLPQGWPE